LRRYYGYNTAHRIIVLKTKIDLEIFLFILIITTAIMKRVWTARASIILALAISLACTVAPGSAKLVFFRRRPLGATLVDRFVS
jgi:hypothetical protein